VSTFLNLRSGLLVSCQAAPMNLPIEFSACLCLCLLTWPYHCCDDLAQLPARRKTKLQSRDARLRQRGRPEFRNQRDK
jgi:hypothetical protein